LLKEKLVFTQPDGIVPDSNPSLRFICAFPDEKAINNNISNFVFIILDFKV
jgi:hypothetical protein